MRVFSMRILMMIAMLAITTVHATAKAYEFKFDVANVFLTERSMKTKMDEQMAKINQTYLAALGMSAKVISVNKEFSTHTIRGEVTGTGCLPSLSYFQVVNLLDKAYPVGVDESTIRGIGIQWPAVNNTQGPGYTLESRFFLAPLCVK